MYADLDGKVVIVTGGGAGIGEAIARAFADDGCKVVVAGRRKEPIERVAGAISGLAVPADVSKEADVAALIGACEAAFGRLDILINNAAVVGPTVSVADEDAATWDETFAINVRGVALCIKHAAALLKKSRGAIVNISSIAGIQANPRRGAYAASKHAVLGLTHAAAFELGPDGVRVNAVCPGGVDTEMFRELLPLRKGSEGMDIDQLVERAGSGNALGRLAKPDEVAQATLFLASDAAGAITGQHLVVDAGKR